MASVILAPFLNSDSSRAPEIMAVNVQRATFHLTSAQWFETTLFRGGSGTLFPTVLQRNNAEVRGLLFKLVSTGRILER